MQERQATRPPLVLIANEQEWATRSLETILGPNGYAVLRSYTGRDTLERARTGGPDLVIISDTLPDMSALEVCRALRDDAVVTDSTAILIITQGRATREQRITALRAGACEYLGQPLDADELPLRLHAYVRAKFDADRVREESLLDRGTGLYNTRGLVQRARELGAQAFRNQAGLACVVVAADGDHAAADGVVQDVARALRRAGRVSDAIGRVGPNEFAIIALGADAAGAVRLAQRVAAEMKNGTVDGATLRVGYDSVTNFRDAPIEPMDMLVRATSALRTVRNSGPADWIRAFQDGAALS